jgi:hypothetical protein
MKIPRFMLGDATETPDSIFVIHTEFPRCIIDLSTDELQFWDDISNEDKDEMRKETESLVKEASDFYDAEVRFYEAEEN